MAKEVYRIEIPIEAIDNYSREMDKAQKKTTKYEQAVQKSLSRIEQCRSRLLNSRWSIAINAIDEASRVISRINSFVHRVANRSYKLTIRAFDLASKTIGFIKRSIFSLPSVITIGLSIVGINKLNEATVGAAMNFEQYEVSMTHWLGGNIKQAKELMKWMGQFADKTPYSSAELFPALSRGVGVAGGNVKEAQKLLEIAANMTALTPGKTVEDSMEALADARVGEFARLTEYGFKISKKEFDRIGWDGVISQIDKTFKDGANKLSRTAAGQLSTIRGYISTSFREAGIGILDSMKPRLERITGWLDNNQDKWSEWKKTVQTAGEEAAEWAFSKLESAFEHVREKYLENDEFKNLDFEGKVKFIMGDINQWWTSKGKPALSNWWESTGKPWAVETGTFIGEAIFSGIVAGLKGGLSSLKDIWTNAFKDPSFSSIGGALTATALAGAAGSMLLSPFLRMGKAVGKGGKWAWNKTIGKSRGRRSGGDGRRSRSQTSRRAEHRQERRRAERERMRRITTPTWDLNRTATEQPTTRAGRAARNQRWYQKLWQRLTRSPGSGSNLGISSMGGMSRGLSRIPFLRTGLSLLSLGTASEEEMPGLIGSIAGGFAGAKGGALAGAAIGSVIPGVGTAVGGAVGGILGGIGGSLGGEWLGNHWDTIKEKASDAASWVSEKFSETKETLSSTLFSGEWWGSKWEEVKQTAASTVFSGGWWAEQVGFVYGYLESTLFSGDWWSGKWEEVKAWTSEKWSSATEIWNNTVSNIGETLFNGEWWVGNWESVKSWASDTVNSFSDVWSSAKSLAESTLFSADWWSGKWSQVKSWASSAWENIKSGFSLGRSEGQSSASVKKYASGGLITRPHLGLVGEAGPEMIIPLSSGRRNRALELYRRTGQMLGVRQYADGGLVGSGISTPLTPTGQSAVGGIYFGDINIYPVVSVEVSGDGDLSAISDEIVDEVGVKLADKVMEALGNMFINAK